MLRNCEILKNWSAIISIFLIFCPCVSAQIKTANNQLANFEKSVREGKINEIERPLLNYAVANPNDPKALELLADVRFQQGRLTEAKGLYQRVLTLDPNFIAAKISLGRIAYASGQKDEAREVLNSIVASSAVPIESQLELATALFFVGEFQKVLYITEKLPPGIKNKDALPLIAAAELELGNKQKLTSLIPQMKKAAANSALAVQCAEVLRNAGMNKESADLIRAALVFTPRDVNLLIQLARLEISVKDFVQARQHLDRADKLQPRSAEILSAKALLENSQGNVSAAFELLNEARQISPDSTVVLADFVILAMRSNKTQVAVDTAKNLVILSPGNPEYKYLLGAASLQNGNIALAQENLESFMRERPNDSRGCLALGLTFAAQRDQIETARKQLNRCLEINPKNYEATYQLGLSYKAQGETATAIRYFEETVKFAPEYASALRDLGSLYLQTGAEPKAQTVLEKAVAINPNDADTHFQLSRLYNLIGRSELAKQHLEMFQKIRNGGKVSP